QRLRFVERWMKTGRWQKLLNTKAWRVDEHLLALGSFPETLQNLLTALRSGCVRDEEFELRLRDIYRFAVHRPALHDWASAYVRDVFPEIDSITSATESRPMALLCGYFSHPVLIAASYESLKILFSEGEYYAIPEAERAFETSRAKRGEYAR